MPELLLKEILSILPLAALTQAHPHTRQAQQGGEWPHAYGGGGEGGGGGDRAGGGGTRGGEEGIERSIW